MGTRTLGIDLASQPKNTALCEIEWGGGRGTVASLEQSADRSDLDLVGRMLDPAVTVTAIDAPFGWPKPFVDAVVARRSGAPWPVGPDDKPGREALYLRTTDRAVEVATGIADEGGGPELRKKRPLSVSTDKIAIPAMRCAGILAGYSERAGAPVPLDGSGAVIEVYPDAALREWHILPREWDVERVGYKGSTADARDRRENLVRIMVDRLDGIVGLAEHADECMRSDDKLDAVVCALVARAKELLLTEPLPQGNEEIAREEGWIHLPRRGSLKDFVRAR